MTLTAVRGMHDLFGDELSCWKQVETKVHQTFREFGYQEFRTPVLEKIEVFQHTVGDQTDIVEKQMYTLTDLNQEKLALRPEGTAAFIRAIVENQLHRTGHPLRYYYYLPMYRHERPQKGRLRQFHQFGAELLNDATPHADAEIIFLLDQIFRSLGLSEYEIRINSVGCSTCRPAYKETLKSFFKPRLKDLCEECQKRFERSPLRILDCKRESCQQIAAGAPRMVEHLCAECISHHDAVKADLKQLKVGFIEDSTIVRGLDYYVRTAFEFTSSLLGAQSALGGGGRYDAISQRFGDVGFPGVGYAFGMERLMIALIEKQLIEPKIEKPHVFLAALGQRAFDRLFALQFDLQRKGIRAAMSYDVSKGLKWLLKQADRTQSKFALIVGDNELDAQQGLLKEMATGQQDTILLGAVQDELHRRVKSAT